MAYIDSTLRSSLGSGSDSVFVGGGALSESGNYAIRNGDSLLGFADTLSNNLAAQYPGCTAFYIADGTVLAKESDGASWYDMRGSAVADTNNPKIYGNSISIPLTAETTPADDAVSRWISTAGANAFRLKFGDFGTTTIVIVGWSNTYDDWTVVDANIGNFVTDIGTPTGAEYTDCVAYYPTSPYAHGGWIYVPDLPAKTIAVEAVTANLNVILEVVKVI